MNIYDMFLTNGESIPVFVILENAWAFNKNIKMLFLFYYSI